MLFTFPSQYSFTIGLTGVFSLTGWSRRIRAELHVFRVTQDTTTSHHASDTGLSPSMIILSSIFASQSKYDSVVLQPLRRIATSQVWAIPRSLATTRGIIKLFSFPTGTKMFQFPAFAPIKNIWVTIIQTVRLSHSEILGSKIICIYPRLIAAYHVLHRLREPRHPPYALNYFLFILYTTKLIILIPMVAYSCSYFQLYFEI